jgi:hypothetical protein
LIISVEIPGFCRGVDKASDLLEFLRGVGWHKVTDVSGQHIGPIPKGPSVMKEISFGLLASSKWDG